MPRVPQASQLDAGLAGAISKADAELLTARIERRLINVVENLTELELLITRARDGAAHVALGFRSWPEYVTARFGGQLTALAKFDRGPVVDLLAHTGMSSRGIAAATGISKSAVNRQQVSQIGTAGGDDDEQKPAVAKVVGLDGKTYTAPRPTPRRRPFPDQFFDATFDLDKAVDRVVRLADDDRLPRNREAIAHQAPALGRAANRLLEVLEELGIDRHKYAGGEGR